MSPREVAVFIAISGAVALAAAAFTWEWLRVPTRYPVVWVVLTLIVAYHLALWAARWVALAQMRRPLRMAPRAGLRVGVATTFVPGGEPLDMLDQTVRAMIALEYPHDTWVLDEGDDPAVRELCDRLGAKHFSRKRFPEYQTAEGPLAARTKHGNYNAWLDAVAYAQYDVIVNLDTDHVPEPHFLVSVLGYFRDPAVAYVQAPQCYYNQDASFVARGAAEETYAYHSIHQMASFGLGQTVIVGCHATHRATALREVGGFPAHDAEDLLLTARYRSAGWRGVYVPEILALGTTAVDWAGYLRQQLRWARSTLDVKLRAHSESTAKHSPVSRLLWLFHGSYYLRPLTVPILYALPIGLMLSGIRPRVLMPNVLVWGGVILLIMFAAERFRRRFFLDPRREGGLHWRAMLLQFAKWPIFLVAVWDVLARRQRAYELTVKVDGARRETLLRRPHLVVAVVTVAAWVLGEWWHSAAPPTLTATAVAITILSLTIALTEEWRFPAPFEQGRYPRRRAELADLLGTADGR